MSGYTIGENHNMSNTRLYRTWAGMKQRCYNIKETHYKDYGGRGITVCDEWRDSFLSFYKWSMENGYDTSLTIDRNNNDGSYCPDNCQWISHRANTSIGKRRKFSNNKSGFTGVSFDNTRNKWFSSIRVNDKNINLGRYVDINDAIKARQDAEIKYFKERL
jgi:outer membrane receptor protein involved in Fe transport